METYLARAIELAKAGHKAQARELLVTVLNEDPRNVAAWKWYATVAGSKEEARQALDNILILSPGDGWARNALDSLEARVRQQAATQARPVKGSPRPRGSALGLAVGLSAAVAVLCVAGVALATVGSNIGQGISALSLDGPSSGAGAVPAVDGEGNLVPPALPPSWTPSAMPSALPTVTPLSTPTPTTTSGPTVTKVPTPAVFDSPVQSDFDAVPADSPLDTSQPVVESQSVQYYTVTGSNAFEINQSILDNGPKGGGQDAIAQIQYTIALHYTLRQTATSCAPEEAIAYLTLDYTYPRYDPPPGAPPELLSDWDNFMGRVISHEATHAQIARECALDMVTAFYAMSPTSTCSTLQSDIEALQTSKDEACDARQFSFDESQGGDSFP